MGVVVTLNNGSVLTIEKTDYVTKWLSSMSRYLQEKNQIEKLNWYILEKSFISLGLIRNVDRFDALTLCASMKSQSGIVARFDI